jgi:hypothetical protein
MDSILLLVGLVMASNSSTDHGGGERPLRTANEKGPFGVAKSEEAALAGRPPGLQIPHSP